MATTNLAEYKSCGRAECEVKKTGTCANGFQPLDACPSYGRENITENHEHVDVDSEDIDEEDIDYTEEDELDSDDGKNGFIDLPSGQPLTISDVDFFLRRYPIRLITIVGDRESGKTTLICSIYERFLHGAFEKYLFAGSKTLIGLDQRHHYSRFDSKLSTPATPRTTRQDGLHFFHFSICRKEKSNTRKIELMLSDRAGEKYAESRDDTRIVRSELFELYKANQIILLLDGARVADKIKRENAFMAIRQYIQTFLDEGAINEKSNLHIVTTKLDLIKEKQLDEQTIIFEKLERFQQTIFKSFGNRVGRLLFSEISAQIPDSEEFGVDKLLMDWIEHKPMTQIQTNMSINQLALKSEFEMLVVRTP